MYYTWAIVGRIWGLILVPLMLWRGGPVERLGAAIYALAWGATFLLQDRSGTGPGMTVLIIDGMMALAFIVLSVRSRKLWTVFAAGCAINAVLSHLAGLLGRIDIAAYVTAITMWGGYGMLASLTAGLISVEWTKRKRAKAQSAAS